MMARRIKLLILSLGCLVSLFAGPSMFATIWGPVGVPPIGTTRDVTFYSCSSGTPSYTGYEEWDCLRDLYQVGSPDYRAIVTDTDCNTWEVESITYWCKTPSGYWDQISETWFNSCHPCWDIE